MRLRKTWESSEDRLWNNLFFQAVLNSFINEITIKIKLKVISVVFF